MNQHPLSRRVFLGGVAGGVAAGVGTAAVAAPAHAAGAPAAAPAGSAGVLSASAAGVPLDNRMSTDQQWADFLAGQDLIWKRLPTAWTEGAFLGNGRLGTMVYREPGKNAIRFNVQHAEVQDHRPQFGHVWGVCRLPVGHFTLEPAGTITKVDLRLSLWNAGLSGTVTTSAGTLSIRAFVQNDRSTLVTLVTPSTGERVRWAFHPAEAVSPAQAAGKPAPDRLFALLRRAINYYLHFLQKGSDNKLHLPKTMSPEYGAAPDCNYDLALLRWGLQTLIDSARRLGINDPLAAHWQEVLTQLVPYPSGANGYLVGAGMPYAQSHRHYSHLMMVYPLHLVNWDQTANRAPIERSFRHWTSLPASFRGFSWTGAASFSAHMGRGDEALKNLMGFFDTSKRYSVTPNTMYAEAGPVHETPLSGSQSLHDMLVQSWDGVIRVFPAVPTAWKDVTVHDFRTQGAFLVSAVRRGGVTQFVRLRSLAGERCRLRTGIAGSLTVLGDDGAPATWRDLGDGVIEIDVAQGREVLVHAAGTTPDLTIAPVAPSTTGPRWGLPS